jgi:DNA-binding Lrp family transcriptional regulator
MSSQIDAIDRRILQLLQKDGKMKIKEIAGHLNMTTTPVFDRIKRLERDGYIRGYSTIVDREKLGFDLVTFVSLTLDKHHMDYVELFEKDIHALREVVACYHIAGRYDYLLKVVVEDMQAYQGFITQKLGTLPYIRRVQSSFVMTEVKMEKGVPLD